MLIILKHVVCISEKHGNLHLLTPIVLVENLIPNDAANNVIAKTFL